MDKYDRQARTESKIDRDAAYGWIVLTDGEDGEWRCRSRHASRRDAQEGLADWRSERAQKLRVSAAFSALGKLGARASSKVMTPAKIAASRANGKLGGRPKAKVTITVTSGNGLEEARDWQSTLLRMYIRWGEMHGCTLVVHDTDVIALRGRPGLKSLLATEAGVHVRRRVSPFDPEHRRHTAFAVVSVDGECGDVDGPRRTYVFHPYKAVQDHPSPPEDIDPESVLAGDLDRFLGATKEEA